MAEKTKIPIEEKEYVIPLRRSCGKVPRYKKANKAIRTIKEFLVQHMKIRYRDLNKIRLDRYVNEFVWAGGIKKPPVRIKIRAFKEGDIVRVELSELPKKLKFKKLRIERKEQELTEIIKKKKSEEEKEAEEEKKPEETEKEEEKKKEAEEKKSAVVETGIKEAKEIARRTKSQTKIQKQPKHQKRMTLQK